jgi:hypothetical protein
MLLLGSALAGLVVMKGGVKEKIKVSLAMERPRCPPEKPQEGQLCGRGLYITHLPGTKPSVSVVIRQTMLGIR